MGYQESYMKMKNNEDFEKLINILKDNGEERFENATPVVVITLLKQIKGNLFMQCQPNKRYSFEPGEKFIYVSGERYGQRGPYEFFEECENVPSKIINGLQIYFAECFPSEEIFDKTSGFAKHEDFNWE